VSLLDDIKLLLKKVEAGCPDSFARVNELADRLGDPELNEYLAEIARERLEFWVEQNLQCSRRCDQDKAKARKAGTLPLRGAG
jgi:hypothetical protein